MLYALFFQLKNWIVDQKNLMDVNGNQFNFNLILSVTFIHTECEDKIRKLWGSQEESETSSKT